MQPVRREAVGNARADRVVCSLQQECLQITVNGSDMEDCSQAHRLHQFNFTYSATGVLNGDLNIFGPDTDLNSLAISAWDPRGRRKLLLLPWFKHDEPVLSVAS